MKALPRGHLSKDLAEMRRLAMWTSGGRLLQAEGTSTEALRKAPVCSEPGRELWAMRSVRRYIDIYIYISLRFCKALRPLQ